MYFHLDIGIKYPLSIFFSMSLYFIEINWRHELNGLSSAELRYASIYIYVFTMELFTCIKKAFYRYLLF